MIVREVTEDELAAVTRIHMRAFPDSALTLLGPPVVQAYYRWQLCGPHDIIFICTVEEAADADPPQAAQPTGFLVGGVFNGALSGFMQANRALVIRSALHPRVWRQPKVWRRLGMGLRSLRRGRADARARARAGTGAAGAQVPAPTSPAPSPADGEGGRPFGVLSIAVDPDHWGSPAGRQLLHTAETIARDRRFPCMRLSVDPGNARAVRFYEREGWERESPGPDWGGKMVKTLLPSPRPASGEQTGSG